MQPSGVGATTNNENRITKSIEILLSLTSSNMSIFLILFKSRYLIDGVKNRPTWCLRDAHVVTDVCRSLAKLSTSLPRDLHHVTHHMLNGSIILFTEQEALIRSCHSQLVPRKHIYNIDMCNYPITHDTHTAM